MKQRHKTKPHVDEAATSPAAQTWRQKIFANPGLVLFVVVACLLCLAYTLYTDQTWEDALITLRYSENWIHGNGLTYNPGTHVQGFSSPISMLLLTLCYLLTGQSSYHATFWLYRLFTIPAYAAGGVLLLKAVDAKPPRMRLAPWFLAILYLFDVKNVAFSANGMETAFMLLFVAWAVYLMSRAAPNQWLVRGLCWGGLMWTRPDGFIYIGAFALAEWIFLSDYRRATFQSLVKSAGVALAVYGPWLIFAWLYYGNPIPHTIIAKANAEQGLVPQLVKSIDSFPGFLIDIASQVFCPMYGEQVYWLGNEFLARVLIGLSKFIGIVGLLYFLYPARDRFGRAASLCFVLLCCYIGSMPYPYPWYLPPIAVLGATAFTRAVSAFASSGDNRRAVRDGIEWRLVVARALFAILAVGAISLFVPAMYKERIQQAEIEMGNRAEIGKWLKENADPADSVYLEPLGYIGYYSGLRMIDYPGLVSPEVVRERRALQVDPQRAKLARLLLIPKLKPDWLILRFNEYQVLTQLPMFDEFKRTYVFWRDFNVNDKLKKYQFLPGRVSLDYDAAYAIFKRNSSAN
jgi:hypothetical protein